MELKIQVVDRWLVVVVLVAWVVHQVAVKGEQVVQEEGLVVEEQKVVQEEKVDQVVDKKEQAKVVGRTSKKEIMVKNLEKMGMEKIKMSNN